MTENQFNKVKEQAAENIRQHSSWATAPGWCNHIVAAVEYGENRATVYMNPRFCDDWSWKEYYTNPVNQIHAVLAFHRGTSKLNGQAI